MTHSFRSRGERILQLGAHGLNRLVVLALAALIFSVAVKAADERDGGLDPDNLPAEMTMTLEQLLNDPEGVEPDVDAARCLGRMGGYSTEILDGEHLLFRSSIGKRAWLNRLQSECLGLRPNMALVVEPLGSRLCKLDTVYGIEASSFAGVQSARCRLGEFEPITREHADALVDTFNLRRKTLAASRRAERKAARTERKRKRREAREAKKRARSVDA